MYLTVEYFDIINMLLQQAGSAEQKVSGKTFEEVIGELDEEINKYDSKGSMAIRVGVNK